MLSTNHSQRKSERLESRCTKEQKDTVQIAAALAGVSVTDFTITALLEKANTVIKLHNILELTRKDQEAFASALLATAAPNKALLNAKKRYQKEVKS